MDDTLTAHAETTIDAPVAEVWDALVNPVKIKRYMFGTDVVTDWRPGSSIVWKGEWQGQPYEDKGEVVAIEPERFLVVTHYPPLSGAEDVPANYHTLRYELRPDGDATHVTITQDKNENQEDRAHAEETWTALLSGLKTFLEE